MKDGIDDGLLVGWVGIVVGELVDWIVGCDVDTVDGLNDIIGVILTWHWQVAQADQIFTVPDDGITIVVLVPTNLVPEQVPPVNIAPVLSKTIPFDGEVSLIVTDKVSPGVYCDPDDNNTVPLLTWSVL